MKFIKPLSPLFFLLISGFAIAQPASLELPLPKTYIAPKSTHPIVVDGIADEVDWSNAPWTDFFQDIEGDIRPDPYFDTRVKMLWDDDYIYFYA